MTKVVNWVCDNRLIIFLTLLTLMLSGFPLILYEFDKTFFYSIDPDVVYVTNAILYTKAGIIAYADHPGTPTIMLLYYLFFPLRFLAKYFFHQSFVQWSFDNFSLLMGYCRISELLIYCLSVFAFLKVVVNFVKSKSMYLILIFTWLSIFILSGVSWGIRVVPENFSFLLTSLWLMFFVKFVKTRKYFFNLILVFISGIAVANKFTGLFLAVPAIFLPFYINDSKLIHKFFRVMVNVSGFFGSFLLGILPVIKQHGYIISWVRALFFHTGTHGTGSFSVFDWPTYWNSATSLIVSYPVHSIYICLMIALAFLLIVKRKIKVSDPVLFLLFSTLIGVAVFAKYPVIHYLFVNIILVIFCTSYLLTKIEGKYSKYLLAGLSLMLLLRFSPYNFVNSVSAELTKKRPDSVYSMLAAWTPFWSLDVYREQLDIMKVTKP